MTNPLLASGTDWRLNACVNYGIDNWYAYSEGYRRAAELVTNYVREHHRDQDILIFPVLFLWRHHLELKLKAISRSASSLLGQNSAPAKEHDLAQLFASARGLVEVCFAQFAEKVPRAELGQIQPSLLSLRSLDPRAMAFRYPEDLTGAKPLDGATHINFDVVERLMKEISDVLDGVDSALAIFHDWQQEAFSAY